MSDLPALPEENERLRAVEALIARAKRISSGPGMSIYVADLERALGREAPVPHKMGQADDELARTTFGVPVGRLYVGPVDPPVSDPDGGRRGD